MNAKTQKTFKSLPEAAPIYQQYLPVDIPTMDKLVHLWDINYTIKQLSYLTHSHYRYYGKFPSCVAGKLLDDYQPKYKNSFVLDNFCGSGTTLVEARLRGINSLGIDISWLAVLASNVKSNCVDLEKIKALLANLLKDKVKETKAPLNEPDTFLEKWFSVEAIQDLKFIQDWIFQTKPSHERDFLLLGFLAIIRRVSLAYDGEVRPHINPKKKQRNVAHAFSKKINDMCKAHYQFMELCKPDTIAKAFTHNNTESYQDIVMGWPCHLAISHPPYLNSFNYRPVFSLETKWSSPFESQYVGTSQVGIFHSELKAHPASESITEQYFHHLKECYLRTYDIQEKGSHLAVVIGDCTKNGALIPVIDKTIELVNDIGYKVERINYRTTHYGLGKYAYKHRADYHGDDVQKRDAIIVFKR